MKGFWILHFLKCIMHLSFLYEIRLPSATKTPLNRDGSSMASGSPTTPPPLPCITPIPYVMLNFPIRISHQINGFHHHSLLSLSIPYNNSTFFSLHNLPTQVKPWTVSSRQNLCISNTSISTSRKNSTSPTFLAIASCKSESMLPPFNILIIDSTKG